MRITPSKLKSQNDYYQKHLGLVPVAKFDFETL